MSSKKVVIVDYGLGNLHSVNKAVLMVGGEPVISGEEEIICGADKVILPGVGAFGDCMANLSRANMISALRRHIAANKPFLGICLGMQVLFEESEEGPGITGLGVFPGKVVHIPSGLKVPHMGWNQLNVRKASPLLAGANNKYVYFTHSYCCLPQNKEIISSVSSYGIDIVASIEQGNAFGVQYHPEKSGTVGLDILRKFIEL